MQNGYDLGLVKIVKKHISIPVTFLGGASSLSDIGDLIENYGVAGCSAGSLFVFKGKYRAVLINYPTFEEKYELLIDRLKKYKNAQ